MHVICDVVSDVSRKVASQTTELPVHMSMSHTCIIMKFSYISIRFVSNNAQLIEYVI